MNLMKGMAGIFSYICHQNSVESKITRNYDIFE